MQLLIAALKINLTRLGGLLLFLFYSSFTYGNDTLQVPKTHVLIEVHGKYAIQRTHIFKKNDKWICKTEHSPYFEPTKNPLEKIDWEKLDSESKEYKLPCRDKIVIKDQLKKTTKILKSCREAEWMKKIIEEIDHLCGRI